MPGFLVSAPCKPKGELVKDSSKLQIKIHPEEGLLMSITSSPWLRFCAGIAIILISLGVAGLVLTPLINAIRWW